MATKPKPANRRLTIALNRELGHRLGIAAKLERKSAMRFTEEALTPVVDATLKRHGLR